MVRRIQKLFVQRRLRFEFLEARTVFNASIELANTDLDVPGPALVSQQAMDLSKLQKIDASHNDGTLRWDQNGLAYHYDGPPVLPPGFELQQASSDAPPSIAPPPNTPPSLASPPAGLPVPSLQSNPSFPKKIYLDFDGELISGTFWNNQNYTGNYNTGDILHAPPFSTDSDLTTFSASELVAIQDVWARVSEDFAPFQVDVTTVFPGAEAFTTGGQAIRVMISTDVDATTNQTWFPPAGGVAYLDSWYWTNGTPVWAFSNRLGNGFPKFVAEAVSHEVGHAFGLGHDGRNPSEIYYQGHGAGPTGWAPIMGVGYYKNLTQWSRGEYASANNLEDDLAIISQGVDFVDDDHGNTPATATQLIVGTGGSLATAGIIHSRTDRDAFRFATQAGSIQINVSPFDFATNKSNLDAELRLINAAGITIATINNVSDLNATLTTTVPKGIYTIVVDGVGRAAASGDLGYSDYGSLGGYTVSGTVIPNRSPTAMADSVRVPFNSSVLIDVLANDADADLDLLSIQSIATPSVGTAVMEAGQIRYTPPANYVGQATFSYTVMDELGGTAVGQVSIHVHTLVATRGVFYVGATGASASSNLASDKTPLLPGQSSSFANYTNYSLGLNGLVVDVAGLPASATASQMLSSLRFASWNGIAAGGFATLPADAIPTVTMLGSVGAGSAGRIQITFPNNTIRNTWLRVTVIANAITQLPVDDVFYFGNVIGDVNAGNTTSRLRVNATDTGAVRSNQSIGSESASILNIYDLNRDGRVNATDTGIVRSNQQTAGIVAPITAPGGIAPSMSPAGLPAPPPLTKFSSENFEAKPGAFGLFNAFSQKSHPGFDSEELIVSQYTPPVFVDPKTELPLSELIHSSTGTSTTKIAEDEIARSKTLVDMDGLKIHLLATADFELKNSEQGTKRLG